MRCPTSSTVPSLTVPEPVRESHELGHERRPRPVVELGRRRDLLEPAGGHDPDPVAQRQRLLLVVGDEQRRGADRDLDAADLLAQLPAHLGVERRERLVEQQHLGLDREGPGQRDPLLLAAGQLVRIAAALRRRPTSSSISSARRRRDAASTPRSRSP